MMQLTQLSYLFVIMIQDCIYVVRDFYGNRFLCIGRLMNLNDSFQLLRFGGEIVQNGEIFDDDSILGWIVFLEFCGFYLFGVFMCREVKFGEIVKLIINGFKFMRIVFFENLEKFFLFCIFEYVYFVRSDSMFEGQMVYSVR